MNAARYNSPRAERIARERRAEHRAAVRRVIFYACALLVAMLAIVLYTAHENAQREAYAAAHGCTWHDYRTSAGPVCIK